jgi:hypothetical protein
MTTSWGNIDLHNGIYILRRVFQPNQRRRWSWPWFSDMATVVEAERRTCRVSLADTMLSLENSTATHKQLIINEWNFMADNYLPCCVSLFALKQGGVCVCLLYSLDSSFSSSRCFWFLCGNRLMCDRWMRPPACPLKRSVYTWCLQSKSRRCIYS